MEEREICKEEQDVVEEEMRRIDEYGMENPGTPGSSEKTIAILGDRWWPQTAKQQGDKISKKKSYVTCGKNVMRAQMLKVSLLGVR